jgi:hypothetical protein
MAERHCHSCGSAAGADDRFCARCGTELRAEETIAPDSSAIDAGAAAEDGQDRPRGVQAAGAPPISGDTPSTGFDAVVPPPAPPPSASSYRPPVVTERDSAAQGPERAGTRRTGWWVAAAIICVVVIAAIAAGSGDDAKKASDAGSKSPPSGAATPKPPPTIKLLLRAPSDGDVVRSDAVTIKGVSAPRAAIRVSGGARGKRAKADRRGRWVLAYHVELGENTLTITASKDGFTRDSAEVAITRERSAAELAAIRQRREEEAARRKADFIAQAQTIPYNQLSKNPDKYIGTKVKYTGQIFQIQEDYGVSVILLSVTNDGYGFWDDNVWINYDGEIKGAEDDVITVYGTVKGEKSYETQIGGSTFVPKIRAKYVEE